MSQDPAGGRDCVGVQGERGSGLPADWRDQLKELNTLTADDDQTIQEYAELVGETVPRRVLVGGLCSGGERHLVPDRHGTRRAVLALDAMPACAGGIAMTGTDAGSGRRPSDVRIRPAKVEGMRPFTQSGEPLMGEQAPVEAARNLEAMPE